MQNTEVQIRRAVIEDAEAIVDVRSNAIKNVKTSYYNDLVLQEWAGDAKERVQKLLSNAADVRIVAETNDGRIVAYGELVTQDYLLGACYVSPSFNGQGVGKLIVASLEQIARENNLGYLRLEGSINAEEFYTRCGYKVVEYAKHTMRSGAIMDCVIMRKDFTI